MPNILSQNLGEDSAKRWQSIQPSLGPIAAVPPQHPRLPAVED